MEKETRTRFATAMILAVVFASGVFLGLAADSGLRAEGAPVPSGSEVAEAEASETAEPAAEEERRYTFYEVEPNEEQLSRIEVIVAEYRDQRESIREELIEEYRTAYRAERDGRYRELTLETRELIKGVLSPEQAAEYQKLLDEWEAGQEAESENEDDRN